MALSRIDTTNMIEDVPQSKLDNNVKFRNLLINGDHSIFQRGDTVTGVTDQVYSAPDRWKTQVFSTAVFTISKSTDVPSGQGFASSCKWDCTTANASPSATTFMTHEQRIEGQNIQYLEYGTSSAKSLTASFWVKSNKTGAYTVGLYSADGSRHIESSYTISTANTWEKKIITFAGDTAGTINNDNGEALRLWFHLGAGSNWSSGTHATTWSSYAQADVLVDNQVNLADNTANEWYITGVQLEAGQTASEFEFLPFDINMQRCSRYYTVLLIGATGYATGSGQSASVRESFNFMSPMRSAPSFTTSGLSGVGVSTTQVANAISENGGWVSPFSTATGRIYFAGTFAFNSEL
jgi:hypothetical protein